MKLSCLIARAASLQASLAFLISTAFPLRVGGFLSDTGLDPDKG